MTDELAENPSFNDPAIAPIVNVFAQTLSPDARRNRAVRKLHATLNKIDPEGDRLDREIALVRLAKWVRKGPKPPAIDGALAGEHPAIGRLRLLARALDTFPNFQTRLTRVIQASLPDQAVQSLFARTGIPTDRGLFAETMDRLSRRLIPRPPDEEDVAMLLRRMFPRKNDLAWIHAIPADLVLSIADSLASPRGASERARDTWVAVDNSLFDALQLLASRVSSAGLSDAIRARSPECALRDSPFFKLPRTIDAFLATPHHETEDVVAWAKDSGDLVAECRKACEAVLGRLEDTGVSVDVVYRLELIELSLARLETLFELLMPQPREERARKSTALIALLLEERQRERSLRDIVRTNTHMLARKIIERAGQTGEHYITETRGEWIKMFFSAAGGGFLTGFTAALKFLIGSLHRAPLQDAFLAGVNYATSFVLIQLCGFTLATKQPGMTAAAVAGAIKAGGKDHQAMVTTTARLVRSQLVAAAGNVLVVIPSVLLIDFLWKMLTGGPVITPEYAGEVIEAHHPWHSGTVFYAALTGVILWSSSIIAGWVENWAVYRRLPEAIAEHRIRRFVGRRVTGWASRWFARNISGIGGNVALGFLLAFTKTIGTFTGLPLDVRHVTLSTASLVYAVSARGPEIMLTSDFAGSVLGILIILVLNLGVSFGLAMVVAMRARDVSWAEGFRTFVDIVVGFFRSPVRFFLPIEGPADRAVHIAHGHGEATSQAKPGH
jgi:site-specific recombinase